MWQVVKKIQLAGANVGEWKSVYISPEGKTISSLKKAKELGFEEGRAKEDVGVASSSTKRSQSGDKVGSSEPACADEQRLPEEASSSGCNVDTPKKRAAPRDEIDSPEKQPVSKCMRRLRGKSCVRVEMTLAQRQSMADVLNETCSGYQGNPLGLNYERTETKHCRLCGVAKHSAKWMMRSTGSGASKCAGSCCYCCYRAAYVLDISRSPFVLQHLPEVKRILALKSSEIRNEISLYNGDVCMCVDCSSK
ncbi:unnamed protein product [Symbiodinium sp. CCMP2592]|nr:unnamed protein product [Symbiodinium sp. CCMP2592]